MLLIFEGFVTDKEGNIMFYLNLTIKTEKLYNLSYKRTC